MAGRGIAVSIQPFYHIIQGYAVCRPLEDLPDDGGSIFVDKQLVAVIRGFLIPVGRARTDESAVLHGLPLLGFYLFADVGGVCLVYHIFQRHNQVAAGAFLILAVILVVDRDKPDLMQREIFFDIISAVNGVAAQPRQVFDYNAVDFAVFHIIQHPLERFALKGAAGRAVVGIDRYDLNIRAKGKVGFHDLLLSFQ